MTWEVAFHPEVLDEDLPRLPKADLKAILKAVRKKLGSDPEAYGEPLRRELFGYWKLRVGMYRVVYRIDRGLVRVLIVKVGARKDSRVYDEMLKRARRLAEGG